MLKLTQTLTLYRFYQAVYVIADSMEQAKNLVDLHTGRLSETKPQLNDVWEHDEHVTPLHVQPEYVDLIGGSEGCVSEDDNTQLENTNKFIRFIEDAQIAESSFPIVPQLELSASQFVRFLITLAQLPSEVCANTKAYYFLRYPSLEQKIKDWNLKQGFSSKGTF